MIRFLSDWERYPNAIPDYQTKNRSFIRLAQVYKAMGVRNHLFHLALHNPLLQGVDPHSPSLTAEQKMMIGVECFENPWYFFREVFRVPPQGSANPRPLRANRGNIGLYWSFFNHIDVGLIQPRQTGKSVSTDGLMCDLTFVAARNCTITMITKDNDLRRKNVERLKGMRDLLPKFLVPLSTADSDNQIELTCRFHNNNYMTAVAQNSEQAANNTGRGLTTPILHSDEGPFTNFINITLPAALAAGTAARDEAREFGRPYGNIFTTTAGKKDSREGAYMYKLIHDGAIWDERYFDAPDEPTLRDMVVKAGKGKRALVNMTLSHKQLGYTDEWLADAIANAGGTPEQIERDFLNIWTAGSLQSPLSVALNEMIAKSEQEIQYLEISPEMYTLRWYIPEHEIAIGMASGWFVMGLDTSEAVGRDTIAMVIMDIRDLSVVAAATYNETNLIRFSNYLVQLLVKYTNMTLVIEKKSTGQMIIDYLLLKLPQLGHDPFKRIFNRIVDNAREDEEAYREILRSPMTRSEVFYDMRKSKFGFNTTAENRNLLYTTVLQQAAKKGGHLVRDRTLSGEIRGLVHKNGRIDHQASGNDDTVIAWLLCHWFATLAKNLNHYGIPTNEVMSMVSEQGRQLTEEEQMMREEQTQIMGEIDTVLDELKNAKDEYIIMKLEHRLRVLGMRLRSDSMPEATSMDAMIQQVAEERQKRQRMEAQQQRRQQMASSSPWGARRAAYWG